MPVGTFSPEGITNLLRGVIDPELGSDIVDLGMVKGVEIGDDGFVDVTVALTTAGCPLRAQIQRDVRTRIETLPEVSKVHISWTELDDEGRAHAMARARWNAKEKATTTQVPPTTKVLAVASGKVGVGKSSVTANLAAALAAREVQDADAVTLVRRARERAAAQQLGVVRMREDREEIDLRFAHS